MVSFSFRKPSSRDTNGFIGEFLGTLILTMVWSQSTVAGFAIAPLMYAFGPLSGGHFNPCITVGAWLRGGNRALSLSKALLYIVEQIAGALMGAWLSSYLLGGPDHISAPVIPTDVSDGRAFTVMVMWCTALVLAYLHMCTTEHTRGNQYFGFAMAALYGDAASGAGRYVSTCFNPAIASGVWLAVGVPDSSSESFSWVYWVGPMLGSVLAVFFFFLTAPSSAEWSGNSFPSPGAIEKLNSLNIHKYVMEALGTMFLTFVASLGTAGVTGANAPYTLVAIVYFGGPISGGVYNPAVQVALFIKKRFPLKETIIYIVIQVVFGLIGAWIAREVADHKLVFPFAKNNKFKPFVAELIFALFLAYTVCTVTHPKNGNANFFGIAIGFSILLGGMAVSSVSGAVLNPAVAAGICAFSKNGAWWLYIVGPLLGGALAGGIHAALMPDDKDVHADSSEGDGMHTHLLPEDNKV